MADSQEEAKGEFVEQGESSALPLPNPKQEQGDIADIDTAFVPIVPPQVEEQRPDDITTSDTAEVPVVLSENAEQGLADIAKSDTAIVPVVSATPALPDVPVVPPVTIVTNPPATKMAPGVVQRFRHLDVALPASLQPFGQRVGAWRASFRLWRLRRPFWGAILMLIASLLMLWGPLSLLRFALFPGSTIWSGILVGALLFVMALIQLLAPQFSLITGAIGIVLSLVSLLVAGFGGLVLGVILGTIGSALGIAWKADARPLPTKRSRSKQGTRRGAFIR